MPRIKDLITRGELTSYEAESLYGPNYNPNTVVEVTAELGSALVTVTEMSVEQGSEWTLPANHSMQLYVGPSNDLTILGEANINGDALVTTNGKSVTVSGTMHVPGTLIVKELY